MSLTEIDVNCLKDSRNSGPLLIESTVRFGQQCVINEHSILNLYNVFWVKAGTASVQIDFNTFEIADNTLFFLFPGQVFAVKAEDHLDGYRLAFEQDFYCLDTHHPEIGCNGLLFNKLSFSPLVRVEGEFVRELDDILHTLIQKMREESVAQSELVQSYLKIFLIKCAQIKKYQVSSMVPLEDESLKWLSELNALIEKNFRRWHGVSEYAKAINLSPKSLTKKMAKYRLVPSQLIQDRLILEAKRMLYYGGKPAKEVAFDLGFEDPSYFSRFFKNKTGLTPGEFLQKPLF